MAAQASQGEEGGLNQASEQGRQAKIHSSASLTGTSPAHATYHAGRPPIGVQHKAAPNTKVQGERVREGRGQC